MAEEPILTLHNLSKTYKAKHEAVAALSCLDLEIQKGEIFGLLGPNGAGKTTTVKMIMGLMAQSSGDIIYNGTPLTISDTRERFGFLPESFQPNPNLTVKEYINFQSRLATFPGSKIQALSVTTLLRMVGMDKFPNRRISDLSKGMGQRVGLAQAFSGSPDFLILDEPTSGLDPIGRSEIIDLLLKEKDKGKTIFFCSHILSEVERLCDRIGILVSGQLKFLGTVPEFLTKWQAKDLDEGFRKEVQC